MAKQHELAGGMGSSGRSSKKQDLAVRRAVVETLEGRVLLAVTAGEYDTIRSSYPEFSLPADMASVNIIEVTPDRLGVASLTNAIATAESTALPDLVVLRTTDTRNTITYASSSDTVSINIPSTNGAISIVGFGSKPLTIDAANQERVIYVGGTNSTTTVNLGGMTLTRGYVASGYGGGVYQYYGTLTMANVTISGNWASLSGGGIYQERGALDLTNVTISENMSSGGGGIYHYYGTSTLTNVTISGNTASDGGGVFRNSGTSILRNTIVARNAADTGPDVSQFPGTPQYPAGVLSGSNNLIGDGSGETSLVNGSNGNLVGSSTSPIDPKLAEGTRFGIGLSPLPGSPAIDTGDNSLVPTGVGTDVYGAARVQGARVNIGAVETVLPGMPGVTYVVTSLGDSIAADGVTTLREALAAANSNQAVGDAPAGSYSLADAIAFAPGLSGSIYTSGQAYQIRGGVDITGPGVSQLTLDGGGASGVLDIRGVYDVSISGMTVTRGNAADDGGGIYAAGSHLTLDQMVISGNTASGGGGVYLYSDASVLTNVTISGNSSSSLSGGGLCQSDGTLILTNVTISGNSTPYNGGGMVQSDGVSTLTNVTISGNTSSNDGGGVYLDSGTSTLTNVTISGNTSSRTGRGSGGGVYLDSGTLTLTSVTISGNTASSYSGGGGGVYQYSGTSTMTNVTISGNTVVSSPYGGGGGMYQFYGTSNLTNVTISGNTASSYEGGGFLERDGTSTLTNVTISGNTAADGGGVYLAYQTATLTNVTISGNTASRGGGAYLYASASTLVNVTISGNTGSIRYGGVVFAGDASWLGPSTVHNTIVARNGGSAAPDMYVSGSDVSGTNNLIGDGSGQTVLVNGSNGNLVGTSTSPIDPQFVNKAGSDWTKWDLRLQATSPAVDAGDNAWIPTGVTTDITGGTRIIGGTVDMGAYEHQPTDIVLSANAVAENRASGTVVGMLSMMGADAGGTFTYLLVTGAGSTDNASFTISGNQLLTAASFNYEAKSSYSIRVRSTDQGGLWCERVFRIYVTNVNEAPTNIGLSSSSIAENWLAGSTVGTLSTTDPDSGNTFTYSLVSGTGSTDNGSFAILGSTLKAAASFNYEAKSSYSIRVRSTDQGGLWYENAFTISVTDVNEMPTDVVLSNASVAENQPVGTAVGTLSTADLDAGGNFTYSLVSGTGSTDNGSFTISGNQLLTNASFDFETKSSYSIRLRTTDQGGLWYEKTFTINVTDVDDTAPTVTAVYVRGSTWASGYLSFLAANTAGSSATYGYAIPAGSGAAQLQTLPWRNLNRISIAFSEDVSIAQAQFAIVGSVGSYSVSGFSYNSSDHVATWSLSAAIGPDKLYVAVAGRGTTPVTDAAGNILDGQWTNPTSYSDASITSSFPSGDGLAGGNFAFRFDVLPGDSTGGSLGKVNVADVLQTSSRSNLPVSLTTYRSDFDGSNAVNVADVMYVKSKSSIYSLPTMPPLQPTFGPVFSQVSLLLSPKYSLLGYV